LTDFGISKEGLVAEDSRTATFCGTPEYLAPVISQSFEKLTVNRKFWKEKDIQRQLIGGLLVL
jgi:serine/threonine protein kinase